MFGDNPSSLKTNFSMVLEWSLVLHVLTLSLDTKPYGHLKS
uniref:Uncharacterized protein n=1 Tax=Rhizophora mucronata TaxID=61149 RepID=A0A2P2QFI1_RHIMU